LIKQIITSK